MSQIGELTLREVNREVRRQRILETARQLIERGGMAALTMRKLAGDADLSVTTLYNLFGSRDDIVSALVHDAIDRIDQILEREAPLEDPIERCRAIIDVAVGYIVEHQAVFRPMILALQDSVTFDADQPQSTPERGAHLQQVAIDAAITQGLLRDTLDPAVLSSQIYHGYELASIQWAHGQLDEGGFRARALYGLYVALLAVATERVRPLLEERLHELERELATQGRSPWNSRLRSAS